MPAISSRLVEKSDPGFWTNFSPFLLIIVQSYTKKQQMWYRRFILVGKKYFARIKFAILENAKISRPEPRIAITDRENAAYCRYLGALHFLPPIPSSPAAYIIDSIFNHPPGSSRYVRHAKVRWWLLPKRPPHTQQAVRLTYIRIGPCLKPAHTEQAPVFVEAEVKIQILCVTIVHVAQPRP